MGRERQGERSGDLHTTSSHETITMSIVIFIINFYPQEVARGTASPFKTKGLIGSAFERARSAGLQGVLSALFTRTLLRGAEPVSARETMANHPWVRDEFGMSLLGGPGLEDGGETLRFELALDSGGRAGVRERADRDFVQVVGGALENEGRDVLLLQGFRQRIGVVFERHGGNLENEAGGVQGSYGRSGRGEQRGGGRLGGLIRQTGFRWHGGCGWGERDGLLKPADAAGTEAIADCARKGAQDDGA